MALESYSGDLPPNPLITMRHELDLSQPEFAKVLGVAKTLVQFAEDACYSLIPRIYRARIRNIVQINGEYQEHRRAKRLFFWDARTFPKHPAPEKPMVRLLEYFDLTPYHFSTRACVQGAEVWKMCTDRRTMTANFVDFLETIGIDEVWMKEFNDGLSRNAKPRVQLPASTTAPGTVVREQDVGRRLRATSGIE